MSADDLIQAGLAERERQRQGRNPNIASVIGAPRSVAELVTLQGAMREKRLRHTEYCQSVEQHMIEWRRGRERQLASIPDKQREDFISAEYPAERKRALESGAFSANRVKVFGEIQAAHASAQSMANLFADGIGYLNIATLDSEKRARYASMLANAGPAAVSNAIQSAVASGNRDLLAAAIDKVGTLNKSQREQLRVNPRDACNVMLQSEMRDARAALLLLDLYAAETSYEAAKVSGATIPNNAKLELGMKRKTLEALAPELVAEPDPKPENAA
jgi:hypothetical protein